MERPQRLLSVCVLTYGDFFPLAERCLGSIVNTIEEAREIVADFRIGLNEVCAETRRFSLQWASHVWHTHQVPVYLFESQHNVFQYPLMRRMFFQDRLPLASLVMWFDDDSFLEGQPGWWSRVVEAIQRADIIGQTQWYRPIEGNQWDWISRQSWFNPEIGSPAEIDGQPCFRFCQGAWWVVRSEILHRYDWPTPELRHKGGDSLFGELARHQRLRLGEFSEGVRINADQRGVHSEAPRRGHTEPALGVEYTPDQPVDLSHHDFSVEVTVYGEPPERVDR